MFLTEDTRQFILDHRLDDAVRLALLRHRYPGVDMPFALNQIQGWQTARCKLPSWAATEGILYPPHLNMEQCSSESTARYKAGLLEAAGGRTLVDLTGGFGVDFSFMARSCRRAVYVERNAQLCELARHNFSVLGLTQAEVVCSDAEDVLRRLPVRPPGTDAPIIYLDPARRDTHGRRVFGIEDCTPDVAALRNELLQRARTVIVKLSPMLDWHAAVRTLSAAGGVAVDVHIVSVANECKELLLVLTRHEGLEADEMDVSLPSLPRRVVCANDGQQFVCHPSATPRQPLLAAPDARSSWLLVPNASVMKAGCFAELSHAFSLPQLDRDSHLFVSSAPVPAFPGRQFQILSISSMNKRELKQALAGISQANIAVRNFPLSADELRRRLRLRDGGGTYVFATTWRSRHVVIVARRG